LAAHDESAKGEKKFRDLISSLRENC
jgi:hypothetical protein